MSELAKIKLLILNNSKNKILTSIFKMERDLLGFSKLMDITSEDDYKVFTKSEIMTLIKYLQSNLDFLKLVFKNESIDDIEGVKAIAQDFEYCYPVYNLKEDIPYWENTSYLYEGLNNFEEKISSIHDTYFAKTTASAYVNLLKYNFIASNTLNHRLQNNINTTEIDDWSTNNAKNNYLIALNTCIAAFFNLCTSINILVEKITSENVNDNNLLDAYYYGLKEDQKESVKLERNYQTNLYSKIKSK